MNFDLGLRRETRYFLVRTSDDFTIKVEIVVGDDY